MPAPRPRQISDILPKLQNVATTSNFLVKFVLPNSGLRTHLRRKGINDRFIAEEAGLLCSDAVLPGSALASINTVGDYQGVVEKMVHTRNFTQINFEFYVDLEYKSLKFLEHWMEYISGASDDEGGDPSSDNYFFQMRYPSEYKSNDTRVVKFERDHKRFLEYRFIGLFPLSINSVRVNYQGSQILKATVTFSYDRYVCGESSSLARQLGKLFNNDDSRGVVNFGAFGGAGGDGGTYIRNQGLSEGALRTTPLPPPTITLNALGNSAINFLNQDNTGLFISESRR